MEVATEEDTAEGAPAQVQVKVSSWKGRVFFKHPLGRDPSWLEELLADSASPDETPRTDTDLDAMIRTPTIYDENQRSTAGQEEDGSDCDLEPKDGEDSELPKAMKVSNSLEDLPDAGKDKRDAAGFGLM